MGLKQIVADEEVIKRFKIEVIRKYGQLRYYMHECVTEALELWLEQNKEESI